MANLSFSVKPTIEQSDTRAFEEAVSQMIKDGFDNGTVSWLRESVPKLGPRFQAMFTDMVDSTRDEYGDFKDDAESKHARSTAVRDIVGVSKDHAESVTTAVSDALKKYNREDEDKIQEKKERTKMALAAQGTHMVAEVSQNILKGSFQFIEQIYEKLKQASPLLQAVEQLFSLAMTLFFMPLGNKLGEMLIPAVIQLMDDVMAIWDSFEGKSLGDMFDYGVKALMTGLSRFFNDIGGQLAKEGGALSNIGHMLQTVGSFLEKSGARLFDVLTRFASFVLDHLAQIVGLIVGFQTAYLAIQIAGALGPFLGDVAKGTAAAVLMGAIGAGTIAGTLTTTAIDSMIGSTPMATGGHVSPVPGGIITRLAEAGEGEWVIPDSKMGALGGNTYNITFNGYNGDDVEQIVRSCVNDSLGRSGFKGGF